MGFTRNSNIDKSLYTQVIQLVAFEIIKDVFLVLQVLAVVKLDDEGYTTLHFFLNLVKNTVELKDMIRTL